jgi:hypothetical protein
MFGKVKKWLGIEGVKLDLALPEMAFEQVGALSGQIIFHTKYPQTITKIKVVMVEKFTRGRGKERRTDEYLLGEITLDHRIEVPSEEPVAIDFTLPFELAKSRMDELGSKNFLTGGVVKVAKMLRNVRSEYHIEAEAKVEGTALNPFDKKAIRLVSA